MTGPTDRLAARLQALSLRQLRSFAAVARFGSFSRAAADLAVTQPALSATIRQIEGRLEVPLFDRTTHAVALSEAGRAILPHVERLLATADHAFADMRASLTHQRPAIRIGVMPSAMAMVAQAVAALDGDAAAPAVQLSDGRSDELLHGLGEGRLDMIVSATSTADARFERQLLVEDDLLLVAGVDHPLARRDAQPWPALTGAEIVHFAGGSIGELAAAALLPYGLAASRRYRVDQVESLYGLARSGLAVGILPRLYTHAVAHQSGIRLIRLVGPVITRKIMLLCQRRLGEEHPFAAAYAARLHARLSEVLEQEKARP